MSPPPPYSAGKPIAVSPCGGELRRPREHALAVLVERQVGRRGRCRAATSHARTRSRVSACSPSSSARRASTSDCGAGDRRHARLLPACNARNFVASMPGAGFEPARPLGQWILSPAASAIPPPGPADIVRGGRLGGGGGGPGGAGAGLAPRLLGGRLVVRRPAARLVVAVASDLVVLVATPPRRCRRGRVVVGALARRGTSTSTFQPCWKPRIANAMRSTCTGTISSVNRPSTPRRQRRVGEAGLVALEPLGPGDRGEDAAGGSPAPPPSAGRRGSSARRRRP